jgi:YesN/AraC family two-component response regulator
MFQESNILLFVVILQLTVAIIILYLIFQKFPHLSLKASPRAGLGSHKDQTTKKKYAHSGISAALAKDLKDKILLLMTEEKIYLDSDLKLKDLADRLGLSVPHTSQLINQNLNKDFNTFINEYRIEDAIDMLENNSNLTIRSVAYEVGFNNNVTFYKAFKKYKGTTPSEYLKELLIGSPG